MKYNYTSVHELLWEDAQEFLSVLPLFFFLRLDLHFLNSHLVLLLQQKVLSAWFWKHTYNTFKPQTFKKAGLILHRFS